MNKELLAEFLIVLFGVFALSCVLLRIIIPILRAHKLGQKILEIGPIWHQKTKEGTPTMGGIGFIIGMLGILLIITVISSIRGTVGELAPLALTLGLGVANGMIGFFDDYKKLTKKQNEGLRWYQKLILQTLCAVLYMLAMRLTDNVSTVLAVPFTDISFDLGVFYYLFAVVLIVGIVNSVNLTDGIDGLAASQTAIVSALYALIAMKTENRSLELMSASTIGGALGFLVFNFYPAKVFMGDTGSLFFGGILVGSAFMIGEPLIIALAGLIFIIEAISDIIQVSVFKLSGRKKRVFKMAPIHHHFEKCGWSEVKIVFVFSVFTVIFCAAAYLM
ncbi:MAG: phospho-N-acetylmuramoyl-pentapeptide-transferase [Ruminococcaceae bacterium]|nr:phospho-N-acetylmuramoyl-pentapeptide-transferase [Oscillospiraceae bacterium]